MPVYTLRVISCSKMMNRFMEAADLFERGKVLGYVYDVLITSETQINEAIVIDSISKAAVADSDFLVSFVTILHSRTIP